MKQRAPSPWPLRVLATGNRALHRATGGRYGSLEPGMAAPRGRTLEVITAAHLKLYRWTSGWIGGSTAGMPTLLLTTTGRKTGLARTVVLPYFPHAEGVLVVGSFAGGPKNPAWYDNLVAKPEVLVQIRARRYRATARTAVGEERAAMWEDINSRWGNYADYEKIAPREIPVVVLREIERG